MFNICKQVRVRSRQYRPTRWCMPGCSWAEPTSRTLRSSFRRREAACRCWRRTRWSWCGHFRSSWRRWSSRWRTTWARFVCRSRLRVYLPKRRHIFELKIVIYLSCLFILENKINLKKLISLIAHHRQFFWTEN